MLVGMVFPGIKMQLINLNDRLSFVCRNAVICCAADGIQCKMLDQINFTNRTLTKS